MTKRYAPSEKVLENYAKVMVHFAVGGGRGVKKGDVVRLVAEEEAKPLYVAIMRELYKSGAHVISTYLPSDSAQHALTKDFYNFASDSQLDFFAKDYYQGMAKQIDHQIYIDVTTDTTLLQDVPPSKIMQRGKAVNPYRNMLRKKEDAGKFTWTLCSYGTKEIAKEAGMKVEEYWDQIIKACFLDKKDPVSEWRKVNASQKSIMTKLDKMKIESLHIKGVDVDLKVKLGKDRKWLGGRGANIPSFELFTSPDWRGTEGWIKFSEPLYRYGNIIKGIELKFESGVAVESKATKNEHVLKEMIATENADKVGEFSLTDKRFSRITKFMATTLYDENMGGKHGNTHIALGNAYRDGYSGDIKKMKASDWKKRGFNESVVHTDIVSTAPRTVTATLPNGKEKVIYKNGQFTI
jgi:aminopeptidase